MAVNFPSNPILDDTYTSGGRTWRFDGVGWVLQAAFTPAPLASPQFTGKVLLPDGTTGQTNLGVTHPLLNPDGLGNYSGWRAVEYTDWNNNTGAKLSYETYGNPTSGFSGVLVGAISFHNSIDNTTKNYNATLDVRAWADRYPMVNIWAEGLQSATVAEALPSFGEYRSLNAHDSYAGTLNGYYWLGEKSVDAYTANGTRLRVYTEGYEIADATFSGTLGDVRSGCYRAIGRGSSFATFETVYVGDTTVGGTDDLVHYKAHRNRSVKPAAFLRAAGEIDATGSILTSGQFNLLSCSKTGTGTYTVTFDTALAANNLGVAASTPNPGAVVATSQGTTTVNLTSDEGGVNTDNTIAFVIGGF